MRDVQTPATADVIRWSFTADPARSAEIETYLKDLGLDVYARGGGHVTALWEEPEGDPDEVVASLWEINGGPFEVTHEEFRRLGHFLYEADDVASEEGDTARAVA